MISAIDTNILLDILRPNPAFVETSAALVESCGAQGPLCICEIVHAELSANFSRYEDLDRFLADNEIRVEPVGRHAGYVAGQAWRRYRAEGGPRERILSDFLIGAHAQTQAGRLLSRDRGFYRTYFRNLVVLAALPAG
jgi:predicted nucleic acid-binding protein